MFINAHGIDVFYECSVGSDSELSIVLLHGWGASSLAMKGMFDYFSKRGYNIINIDLPGFGLSHQPPASFSIEDYAACVNEIITQLSLKNPIIIGHSFGGRLAVLLAHTVKAIVLVSAAGLKPKFSIKKRIRIAGYKRAKRRGKDISAYGSSDYKALNNDMRQVFVRVVNRHLDNEAKGIKCNALLIWGKDDTSTPLYMGKKYNRYIKNSEFVVLQGGHFAFLENTLKTNRIISAFLNKIADNLVAH